MLGSLHNYRALIQKHVYHGDPLTLPGYMTAGIMSGWTVSFVAAPFEHVKARLQVQYHCAGGAKPRYSGPIDCSRQLLKAHGLPGLYHGLSATLLFRTFFFAWWGSYEVFTRAFREHTALSDPAINFWAGGLSAQVFWLAAYPSDVVKQRIMTDPLEKELRRFPRWIDAARAVGREAGWKGYFR